MEKRELFVLGKWMLIVTIPVATISLLLSSAGMTSANGYMWAHLLLGIISGGIASIFAIQEIDQ